MASHRVVDRPIQLRRDDSDEEYISEEGQGQQVQLAEDSEDGSKDDLNEDEASLNSDSENTESQSEESTSQTSEEESEDLKSISFGALAQAQATFEPPAKSRKRKLSALQSSSDAISLTTTPLVDNPHPTHDSQYQKPRQDLTTRSSKHAPTVLSSRHPVSRKRTVISPPPTIKSRDPRFDPTVTSNTLNPNAIVSASKAYSFLTDYQATEILQLKAEIKKSQTSNPAHAADLKRKLMSMESRLRNSEVKTKEREILHRHKEQEKQAIKEGKKSRAFYLKKSDLRKEIEKERVDGMGKKQKDKMEKRKRMREKTKEAKDMPWARRMG